MDSWLRSVEMDIRLRDLDVNLENLPGMVGTVIKTSPSIGDYLTQEDIVEIFKEAY
jgi:hypothetical protein